MKDRVRGDKENGGRGGGGENTEGGERKKKRLVSTCLKQVTVHETTFSLKIINENV